MSRAHLRFAVVCFVRRFSRFQPGIGAGGEACAPSSVVQLRDSGWPSTACMGRHSSRGQITVHFLETPRVSSPSHPEENEKNGEERDVAGAVLGTQLSEGTD